MTPRHHGRRPRAWGRALVTLGALLAAGCVVPPPPGTLAPPRVELLHDDARYGRTAEQVLEHPALHAGVRGLFGADWRATAARTGGLTAPAAEFFARSTSPRLVRIDGRDYVAVSGCMPSACAARRGLLLVEDGGARLLARVDDGGFTHDYGYGPGMTALTPENRLVIDAAWRALD